MGIESESNLNTEATEADQLPEGLIEETDETEIDLDEAIDENAEEGQAADEQDEQEHEAEPQAKEPHYVKGRIEKAVARVREEYEAILNPLREQLSAMSERMLKADAQELVKKGEFRSVETAEEYLRLKQGLPASTIEEPKGQPRNANGQFAPKQDAGDAATQARIDMLKHQASQIKARTGVDVIKAFNEDPNIKKRVIAGEVDFYDVAEEIGKQPKRGKPPAPMRSPNGAATSQPTNAIMEMTDEQFRRLEERVQKGARIRQS